MAIRLKYIKILFTDHINQPDGPVGDVDWKLDGKHVNTCRKILKIGDCKQPDRSNNGLTKSYSISQSTGKHQHMKDLADVNRYQIVHLFFNVA